jgi:hypothetical protein
MTQVDANLSAFNGSSARLRWHEGDDSSAQATGWFVDSVTLANVGTASACLSGGLFYSGFEDGVLPGLWSGVSP